ncbi:MAG: CHAT domain-containing protein [Candidatus Viridilinea halotolerans]|uniref:CHAT domain-containing protein n=1 Tax=Candidatus Viridilinea halotolerans TaxID=2491704 RepID=A0A426U0Y7_9CHLR|nr:MAG: CHAT domain-containing protein [Candidatus Viridilinea halotolerans]
MTQHNDPIPPSLTLRFTPTPDGARIGWESDAGGTCSSLFRLPMARAALPTLIKALDALQHPDYPRVGPPFSPEEVQHLSDLGFWDGRRVVAELHRLVGQQLYAALVADREGELALRLAREAARAQRQALTYLLRFPPEAVELAALPWEALWDARQALLLSRGGRQPDALVRYIDLNEALSPPLPVGQKLHILALAPQAGIPTQIRAAERAARHASWTALRDQGLLTWDELAPVTARALDDRMRAGPPPDVIHYYGHGSYSDGQGYLVFDSEIGAGQHELVSAGRLAALLGEIRLIMLFACQSAMVAAAPQQSLFTGIAPALSAVSEAVVAMQLTVRITAATRFSEVCYRELARGRSLQTAVAEARRSLYVIEQDGASWYVPTLYLRTREQRPVYLLAGGHGDGQGGQEPSLARKNPEPHRLAATDSASALPPQVSARHLGREEVQELVDLLLACPAMQQSNRRASVLEFIEPQVRHAIERDTQNRNDVLQIVTTCNDYPGALDELVAGVRFFDQGTFACQALEAFWRQRGE